MSEKKIYVVVAQYVAGASGFAVHQPVGRVAAQVAHVVSKMRVKFAPKYKNDPITTIILSVPFSEDLDIVISALEYLRIWVTTFKDDNKEYLSDQTLTAFCTEPIADPPQCLAVLPLWDGR